MHKIEVQFSQNLARFAVSLFTREWIEIIKCRQPRNHTPSPSLRGSGLKYRRYRSSSVKHVSPSLRGSGLKLFLPPAALRPA